MSKDKKEESTEQEKSYEKPTPIFNIEKPLIKNPFQYNELIRPLIHSINRNDYTIKKAINSIYEPTANLIDSFIHPKRTAYRIMSLNPDAGRSVELIWNTVVDRDLNTKGYSGDWSGKRDLNALYLWQDSNNFELLPKEEDLGINYDKYLKSIGRDPQSVKKYKGNFGYLLQFPLWMKDRILELANSPYQKTIGREADEFNGDNVGGHLLRLDINSNNLPVAVFSDLWDFAPKEYSDRWSENHEASLQIGKLGTYALAYALDKIGQPFILKDNRPIIFYEDDGSDRYINWEEELFMRQAGLLPEVSVYPEKYVPKNIGQLKLLKANGGYIPTLQDLERNNINYQKSTNNLPSVRFGNGGKLKNYNELSMFEKNEVIATAVRNGLRDPEEIRRKYNEFINS